MFNVTNENKKKKKQNSDGCTLSISSNFCGVDGGGTAGGRIERRMSVDDNGGGAYTHNIIKNNFKDFMHTATRTFRAKKGFSVCVCLLKGSI